MTIARVWATATPAGRDAAQAALDAAELTDIVALDSWTPYPDAENVAVYWFGLQMGVGTVEAVEAVLDASVPAVTRHWRGGLRFYAPAMTEAELLSAFPAPNSGPDPLTIVTRNAALGAHYRDFGLGSRPDDGSPGIVAPAPAKGRAKAKLGAKGADRFDEQRSYPLAGTFSVTIPPRPHLSTLEELREAKLDLADSKVLDLPQRDLNALMVVGIRDLKSQTSERDAALFTELSAIRRQGAASGARAGSSAFWAKFSGLAFPGLLLLINIGGEWGRMHPHEFGGLGALLVAISAAVARFGSGATVAKTTVPPDTPSGSGLCQRLLPSRSPCSGYRALWPAWAGADVQGSSGSTQRFPCTGIYLGTTLPRRPSWVGSRRPAFGAGRDEETQATQGRNHPPRPRGGRRNSGRGRKARGLDFGPDALCLANDAFEGKAP